MIHPSVCFRSGFIGLSVPTVFANEEALKVSVTRSCFQCRLFAFPECTVQIIRESLELSHSKNASRLPPSPSHYIALTKLRWWRVGTRCSISPGRQGEPRANEVEKWQRTYRLTLSLLWYPSGTRIQLKPLMQPHSVLPFFLFTVYGKSNSSC